MAEGDSDWYKLCFSEDELDLELTLSSGQVFTWSRVSSGPDASGGAEIEWRGVIADR